MSEVLRLRADLERSMTRSPEYISGYQAGFVDGYFTDSEQIAPFVEILTGCSDL